MGKVSASRAQNKRIYSFFVETPPNFAAGNVVQVEHKTKEFILFLLKYRLFSPLAAISS